MSACDLPCEGGDRHVESTCVAWRPDGSDRQLAVREAFTRVERPAEDPGESIGVLQEVAEWPATRLVEAESEEVLCRHIGVNRAELRVEHDDAGRQRVEQLCRLEVRERRRQAVFSGHGAP